MDSNVVVVGAGLAGLMAANRLEAEGWRVTVFDKGRGPGGRMATRRIGSGVADHGAQFFTVKSEVFQPFVDEWLRVGLVGIWSYGFSNGSIKPEKQGSRPRYIVKDGMNALAKHLASNLRDVRPGTQIVTATPHNDGWLLQDAAGSDHVGRVLLMTCPVPQSLEILEEGATILDSDDAKQLSAIEYELCLTGMLLVEGEVTLPEPGAIQRAGANIIWMSNNQLKGISPGATVITIQAGADYSRQMWGLPDDRILNALATSLEVYMQPGAEIIESQLKRWQYSQPINPLRVGAYVAKAKSPLLFAGDAFNGGLVEGAVLSGIAAAKKIVDMKR